MILCFGLLAVAQLRAQTSDFVATNNRIQQLIYDNKYNEAQAAIYALLKNPKCDKRQQMVLYVFLSDIKRILVSQDEGMKYARKALAITFTDEVTGGRARALAYHVIANIFYEKKQYDSAYWYATNSTKMAEKHSDPRRLFNTRLSNLPIIGYYYLHNNRFEDAEKTLLEANRMFRLQGSECEIPLQLLKLADLEAKRDNLGKAEKYALEAQSMADSCSVSNYVLAAYSKLIDIYKLQNNASKMLGYVNRRDSLNQVKNLDLQRQNAEVIEARHNALVSKQESELSKIEAKAQESRSNLLSWIVVVSALLLILSVLTVHRLKQKNRVISRQKNEVDRLNLLNRKIFSVVSHDFKGPLHNLQGIIALVEDGHLDAETFKDVATAIGKQTSQANLVLENLLNWAKSEFGNRTGEEAESASPLLVSDEIIGQLKTVAAEKKLLIENHIPDTLNLNIQPDKLRIVYRNLVNNAIKYSFDNGRVTLGYDPVKDCLFVRDEGVGIQSDTLEKLFANSVASGKGTNLESGYGIGLQITAELIRQAGGKIAARNNPERGAAVYFHIPTAFERSA
ncbi:sensor histidine kinase [Flavobacterium selenitireducens]|uniref:sensor histidine kinase n=1 Tax=Flavobacterium selenitireducens TaxID=2722704 RepID=UPI00168BBB0C|nr:HAMP domain-containing sensor histidine kinase [Flavobacterium selenitireducens]MBD3582848.1 HAMP domain-containing histidine kinase [Flavobacterium selenitireducens]